jgi:hypothetical protein
MRRELQMLYCISRAHVRTLEQACCYTVCTANPGNHIQRNCRAAVLARAAFDTYQANFHNTQNSSGAVTQSFTLIYNALLGICFAAPAD